MGLPQDMQQMMQLFATFLQQQQTIQRQLNLEERIRRARQSVIDKIERFEGRDISKFCRVYEQAMEDNGINDQDAINGFHLIAVPEIRTTRIGAIRAQHGNNWRDFKAALKAEYFLEDTLRVTKHSFTKWVQMKNKGLSAQELL